MTYCKGTCHVTKSLLLQLIVIPAPKLLRWASFVMMMPLWILGMILMTWMQSCKWWPGPLSFNFNGFTHHISSSSSYYPFISQMHKLRIYLVTAGVAKMLAPNNKCIQHKIFLCYTNRVKIAILAEIFLWILAELSSWTDSIFLGYIKLQKLRPKKFDIGPN